MRDRSVDSGAPLVTITPLPPIQTNMQTNLPIPTKLGTDRDMDVDSRPHSQRQPEAPINPHAPHQNETQPQMMEIDTPGPGDRNEGGNMSNSLTSRVLPSVGRNRADDISLAASGHAPQKGQNPYESNIAQDDSSHLKGENNSTENQKSEWKRHNSALRNSTDFDVRMGTSSVAEDKDGDLSMGMRRWESVTTKSGGGGANEGIGNTEAMDSTATVDRHTWGVNSGNVSRHAHAQSHNMAIPQSSNHPIRQQQHLPQTLSSSKQHPHLPLHHPSSSVAQPQSDPSSHPPEQPQQQQQHHHAQKPSVPAPTSVPAPKPPANPSPDSSPILKQSVPNVMPIQHPVGPSSPSRAASSGPAASAGHSESQTKSTRTPVKPVVLPGVAAPSTGSASPQAPSDREARQDNEPNSPRLNPSSRPQADSGRLEQAYNSPLTQPSRNPQQQEQQQEQQQQHRKQQQKQEQQEQEQPQPQQEEQQQKSKQQPQQQQQEQQQSQPPPPPQQKHLKVEDALAYLEKVKRQFSDQQNVYNQFLDVMKDFKAQNIDTSEVIKRVSELFRGHKDLILGFNTFLPPGYKIQFTENLATGTLNAGFVGPHGDFSELPTYRNSTTKPPTARFGQNRSKPVAAPPKPSKENVKRVPSTPVQPGNSTTTAALVTNNSSSSAAAGKEPVQIAANGPSAKHVAGHTSSKAPQKQQQSMTPKQSIKEEEVRQPQQSASVPLVQKSVEGHQAKSVEFERAITFMTQIKERFSKESDTFTQFLGAMKHFRDEQKSIREVFDTVAHLFGPHKDLLMKFKEFIPHSQKPSSDRNADSPLFLPPNRPPSPNPTSKVAKNGRDLKFFEKMKVQLGNNKSHLYIEFIKCLSLLSQGIVSQEELVLLTSGILHECPEAQTAFLNYLESFGNNDSSNSSLDDSSSSSSEKGDAPIDEARLQYYKTKQMSEIAAECGIDSIVSYRRMPRDFPKIHYSGRSPQERRILNDTWVNITTGSEDFAFVRKNGCEDNLFRAEDDRYELDMVISTNRATIQKLEVVVSTMSKLSPAEKTRHALATGVLSAIHFNSIRRIYGPHGDEVVSQVRMNPSVAVPIVIPRLKQKDAEWRKVRNEMNKFWRDIGERNFHRSLDHRFGFFKMIDKKDLNMKSLLLDLMDPASSQTARDYEMTRARNYAIPKGAGSTFDRSGATKAVLEAARIAHDYAPRSLRLKFENLWMHKTTFNLIEAASSDEASVGLRRCIAEFGKILEDFFDVDLETGLRRGSEPEDAMETDDAKPKQQANKKSEEKRREFAAANTIDRDVLFGDEAIYVMFRLYHILYERVFTAFEMAHEQVSDRERRERLNEIAGNRVSTESIVKPRLMKFASEKETDGGFALGPETGDGMDVFSRFLEYARPFVRSKLDSSRYEERCRVLLGTGAYCVFTLDKVMQRLIKQIQAVFGSDRVAQELMVIFEKARAAKERNSQRVGGKLDPEGMVELYSIATSRLLSEMRQPGTHLIRFERDYCELRERVLEVGDVRLRRSGVFPDDENSPKSVNVREVTRDKKGCVFSIEVLGETGDEEHFRALEERQECIDSFLGFCASYEDCKVHGPSRDGSFDNGNNVMNSVSGSGAYDGNEYGQTSSRRNKNHGGSDGYGNHHEHMNSNHKSGGGKSQGSGRNGGHSKGTSSVKQRERERERERNRDGTGGSSNKRNNNWSMDVNHANNKSSGANIMRSIDNKRRRLDSQLRRYQPSERKHMIRRAMATVVDNGLRCKMDTNGAVRYMAGTLDWSFTPGRKRRWSDIMLASSSELRKQNEEQRSTKKLRNFLTEYHSKKKDSGNAVVISLATSSRSHSGDDGGGNHANGGSGKRRDRGEGGKGKNRSNSNN